MALFCGDSRKMREVPDSSVHLVIADPPFATGFDYGGATDDAMPPGDYGRWTGQWVDEVRRVLVPGGQLYAMLPLKWLAYWLPVFEAEGRRRASSKLRFPWHMLAWCKTATAIHPEKTWLRAWEPIVLMQKGGQLLRYSKTYTYAGDKDWWIGTNGMADAEQNRSKKRHPTPRPDWIYDALITKCSAPGDVVMDPFLGSGTGAFTAKKLGRLFIGYDHHRPFVELAAARATQGVLTVPDTSDLSAIESHQTQLIALWETA